MTYLWRGWDGVARTGAAGIEEDEVAPACEEAAAAAAAMIADAVILGPIDDVDPPLANPEPADDALNPNLSVECRSVDDDLSSTGGAMLGY